MLEFNNEHDLNYRHHDVNEILTLLLSKVQETSRDSFMGMYLFDSLANGDFDDRSDVDVLVVTNMEISSTMFMALQKMHVTHQPYAFHRGEPVGSILYSSRCPAAI